METLGRILILEPDEANLLNMTDLLQKEEYQCTSAQKWHDFIEALDANEYDLVIAEIQIPGQEGTELIQAIEWHAPGMPVIIHTAYPSLQSAIASIQLPVTAYLVKPVQPEVLLQYVDMSIVNYKASKRKESLLERTMIFTWAIEDTIQVLESTRSAFKSQKLAALRRQLEQILEGEQNEIRKN